MDVIVTDVGMKAEQTGPTRMEAMTKSEKAISFRFEIGGDEIELLGLKEEAVQELGHNIAIALLGFVQAGNPKWKKCEHEGERKLDA